MTSDDIAFETWWQNTRGPISTEAAFKAGWKARQSARYAKPARRGNEKRMPQLDAPYTGPTMIGQTHAARLARPV